MQSEEAVLAEEGLISTLATDGEEPAADDVDVQEVEYNCVCPVEEEIVGDTGEDVDETGEEPLSFSEAWQAFWDGGWATCLAQKQEENDALSDAEAEDRKSLIQMKVACVPWLPEAMLISVCAGALLLLGSTVARTRKAIKILRNLRADNVVEFQQLELAMAGLSTIYVDEGGGEDISAARAEAAKRAEAAAKERKR